MTSRSSLPSCGTFLGLLGVPVVLVLTSYLATAVSARDVAQGPVSGLLQAASVPPLIMSGLRRTHAEGVSTVQCPEGTTFQSGQAMAADDAAPEISAPTGHGWIALAAPGHAVQATAVCALQ